MKAWPHCVDFDDEIKAAMPSPYIRYDIFIKDKYTCETFIKLNGEKWRACAELILDKFNRRGAVSFGD